MSVAVDKQTGKVIGQVVSEGYDEAGTHCIKILVRGEYVWVPATTVTVRQTA